MMRFVATPCKTCPFRRDVHAYLRADRVRELSAALDMGKTFHCHKTLDDTDRAQCAGAEIYLANQGKAQTAARQIFGRLIKEPTPLSTRVPVARDLDELLRIHA